jgi:hypothetical protein
MSSREIMDAKNGIAERKSYGFRDPVVKNVVDQFVSRSDVGYEKYGSTLDDERRFKMKDLAGYLKDIQEELMDAILYIQTAREEIAEQQSKYQPPLAYATGSDYDDETDED